jgi:hypothetical protein
MASFGAQYWQELAATGNPNEYKVISIGYPFFDGFDVQDSDPATGSFQLGDHLTSNSGDFIPGTYVGSFRTGLVVKDYYREHFRYYSDKPFRIGFTFTASTEPYVTCFLTGTLIACPEGPRPVEELAPGDRLLTASGETRTVRWIGHQTILSVAADPIRAYPIHVMAGALGEGLPRRDLFLSPGHALVIDGLLIHAGALVNGVTIRRVMQPGPSFRYFHVETHDHSIILAEGVPTETFLDVVSRRRFDNYAEFEALHGASIAPIPALRMPRVKSVRQLPQAIWDRLERRAKQLTPTLGTAA